jgi:hypothetical protein
MGNALQQLAAEFRKRAQWERRHPVIGTAVYEPGARMTRYHGVAQQVAASAHASRPDLQRELEKLKPTERICPHCARTIDKNLDRCKHCGLFVPAAEKVLKSEFTSQVTQPYPENVTRVPATQQTYATGEPFRHVPSGFVGRLIYVLDNRAALRDLGGQVLTVPIEEIQPAEAAVSPQSLPAAGQQGGFAGVPAVQSGKAHRNGLGKVGEIVCSTCGQKLTDEDIEDGECPSCGSDLSQPNAVRGSDLSAGGMVPSAGFLQGYFASPGGMLKLARQITGRVPNFVAKASTTNSSGGFRKSALSFVRGQKVRHTPSGREGIVLGSSAGQAAVEYATSHGQAVTLEKVSDLEAA